MNYICLALNGCISAGAYLMAIRMIPRFQEMFIKANLFGKDLCKKDQNQMYVTISSKHMCVKQILI